MARRKQLKGIAGNLGQWCLSRSFDCEGYWAPGLLYAEAEIKNSNRIVLDLFDSPTLPESEISGKTSKLISEFMTMNLKASEIPEVWLRKATITFEFNTEYEHRYHHWGSGLGGKPSICIVEIITDLGKTYTKKFGCNVWVHDPKREQRRSSF
ncbi:MAG: hypothetical protein V7785_13605 [Bermanella sp.]